MSSPVWKAADAAIQTLKSLGYSDICFVGGVGCSLHGNTRTPKDLDILVLNTTDDPDLIKRRIADAGKPSFYLLSPKRAGATYKILWYRASPYTSVKVDILIPGRMDLPSFPSSRIDSNNLRTLPSAPLTVVLLHKLHGWSEHRAAQELYYSKEQHKDRADIDCLVPIAASQSLKPREDADLPAVFISAGEARVREFLTAFPSSSTKQGWVEMGFSIPDTIL